MKVDREDWPTLSRLLDEALDLLPPERESWIAQLPSDLSRFRANLRGLLAIHASVETSDFLAVLPKLTDAAAMSGLPQEGATDSGRRIGPYRLLRVLGRGGMGSVWLAERSDGLLKRQVALKLPHIAAAEPVLAERFAREREILAGLVHPNIARLYDAGITEDGQPYLALEHVVGAPLTDYADQRRLSLRSRLQLFKQVLDAVQYAHSRLVVHRDLKPSNILVTADGQVRLLDFGIAKLVGEGHANETELTQLVGPALTPDYASPEQIARQPISTASDVYSLGVLLYQLLTGERPYRLKRDTRGALEEAILTAQPTPLHLVPIGESMAEARSTRAKKLARAFRGELDNIVLKALRKKPEERYGTAAAFADDIDRHLRGDAVLARPDSIWYRTKKLVGRNMVLASSVVAIITALSIGLSVAWWGAMRAREQAQIAQREAKRAQTVQDFLLSIFQTNSDRQNDPIKARQTTARELLDIGARRVMTELKDAPESQAQVLSTLSDTYFALGLDDESADLAEKLVELVKKTYGARDARVAGALMEYADTVAGTSRRDQLLSLLTEASDILDALHDTTSETRAKVLEKLSNYYSEVDPVKALAYGQAAISQYTRYHPDGTDLDSAYRDVARAYYYRGEFDSAEAMYVAAIREVRRRQPFRPSNYIIQLLGLGETRLALAKIPEAESDLRNALAESRRANGESHVDTLHAETRLALLLHATSRRDEARAILQNVSAKVSREGGTDTPNISRRVQGINATCLLAEGRLQDAGLYLARYVAILRQHYPNTFSLAIGTQLQSELFFALGQYQEAQQLQEETTRLIVQYGGSEGAGLLNGRAAIVRAKLALAAGDPAVAVGVLAQVKPQQIATSPMQLDHANVQLALASAYLAQGRADLAQRAAQDVLDHIQQSPVRNHFQVLEADALLRVGEIERRTGQIQNALAHLERALMLREANDDRISPWLAEIQIALADCLIDVKQYGRARALVTKAKTIHAAHPMLGEHLRRPLRDVDARLARQA